MWMWVEWSEGTSLYSHLWQLISSFSIHLVNKWMNEWVPNIHNTEKKRQQWNLSSLSEVSFRKVWKLLTSTFLSRRHENAIKLNFSFQATHETCSYNFYSILRILKRLFKAIESIVLASLSYIFFYYYYYYAQLVSSSSFSLTLLSFLDWCWK